MKIFIKFVIALLSLSAACGYAQNLPYNGNCTQGATKALTQGLTSTNSQVSSFPGCSVSVYIHGTSTLATIFSDAAGTPLTNPFTASANGLYLFYVVDTSHYDVTYRSPGMTTTTLSDISIGPGAAGIDYPGLATNNTFTGTQTFSNATAAFMIANGQQVAGSIFTPTIQLAVTAAGTNGSVLIPSSYTGSDSYVNANDVPITDLRTGTPAAPIGYRTFSSPQYYLNLWDNSPQTNNNSCGGTGPSGIGNAAPMVQLCLHTKGSGNVFPLYTNSELQAGFTGFGAGVGINVVADQGSMPQQVFNNILLADNSGWTITSCTRSSNILTCTVNVTNAPMILTPGQGFFVSGNTLFNSGTSVYVVTGTTANTVTAASVGPNLGPGTGGILGPNHFDWALEINAFNNNHDPGKMSPTSGQNVTPFNGITSTQLGLFPLSNGFFADGAFYEGYISAGSLDADFVAGYPISGQTFAGSTVGFEGRPYNVATSGANQGSRGLKLTGSIWGGSSAFERNWFLQAVPVSNSLGSDLYLNLVDTTGNTRFSFLQGQILAATTTVALPTYSYMGNPTSGLYIDSGGVQHFAVIGANVLDISSTGISTPVANYTTNLTKSGTVVYPTLRFVSAATTAGQTSLVTTVTGASTSTVCSQPGAANATAANINMTNSPFVTATTNTVTLNFLASPAIAAGAIFNVLCSVN